MESFVPFLFASYTTLVSRPLALSYSSLGASPAGAREQPASRHKQTDKREKVGKTDRAARASPSRLHGAAKRATEAVSLSDFHGVSKKRLVSLKRYGGWCREEGIYEVNKLRDRLRGIDLGPEHGPALEAF